MVGALLSGVAGLVLFLGLADHSLSVSVLVVIN